MRVDLLHPSAPKATVRPWRQVVSWWAQSGARHRRTQGIATLLLIVSLLVTQAPPAAAAPCSFTEDGNGDVIIAASCEIAAGTYNVTRDFVINAGVTVTAQGNTGAGTGVVINAGRHITISSTAVLTATGQGYAGEAGPGAGVSGTGASGGSHGGNGGRGSGVTTQGATHGTLTGPLSLGSGGGESTNFGGVQAAAGGGAIKLSATSGTVTISGTVSANGNTAGNFDAGGGAGGSVWIEASALAGTGTITANGGNGSGGASIGGGGGGGGRIAITGYSSGTPTSYAISAQGGAKVSTSAAQAGGAGTIFFKSNSATNGDLIVDNNDQSTIGDTSLTTQVASSNFTFDNITVRENSEYVIPSGASMTLATGGGFTGGGTANGMVRIASGATFDPGSATYTFSGPEIVHSGVIATVTAASVSGGSVFYEDASTGTWSATLSSFTVLNTGTLSLHSTSAFSVPTLTVNSGGTLTHTDNGTTHLYSLSVSATTIDLQTGSIVNVQGRGFDANSGTGAGGSGVDGGGGAHGGDGADPPCCSNGGLAYGSVTQPVTLGSGGGNSGGAGGGAVKLVASGTLTVNTTINANGVEPTSGTAAGGAGGSIWIDADTLAGTGFLSADGENGNTWGGPGSGGRIAVYYNTDSSTLLSTGTSTHAYGAVAESWGTSGSSASGTVFVDDKDDASANGSLILDNNNIDAIRSDTPQLTASQTYDNITIRKGAEYRIGSGETLTLASGGTLTTGGTVLGQLIIDSGGTFTLPSTLSTTISSLNVTNNGTFDPPGATMTISGGTWVNAATFNTVTNLTATGGVNFTHSGNFPASVTSLTVSGASTYLHSGTGMNITNGANFALSGASTFTHNSATGFATGLDVVIGAGTFVAQHTSFNNQNSLTVQNGGTFQQNHTTALSITTVTVQSGGTLNHGDNTTSHLYSLSISATTIDLQTGSIVNVQGRGFDANSGTGAGGSSVDGGGGAHGGDGADPPCCTSGGNAYGSVTQPSTIGSGGGNTGGTGGGAVKLVASGTLTVNTTIDVDGNIGTSSNQGGGAGGSIWLDAGTLAGSGILSADGGRGNGWGGPGGGGRVAVYYTTDSSTILSGGNYHAYGAHSVNWQNCCTYGYSPAGTIYIKSAAATNGDLIIDNNNLGTSTGETQQLTASQTYDNLTIRRGGTYRLGSGETLALASGGTLTTGGTTRGTVITDSGGTFTLPATLSSTISDLNLTNNGAFNPPSATVTWSGGTVANAGSFNTVTNLTTSGGTVFTHSGSFPATLSSLTVTGASNYTHSGTGMSITNGANFILSGSSTFTYNSATGFSSGLDITLASGTFVAQHTSFTNQNSLTVQNGATFQQSHTSTIAITTLTVQSGGSLTHTTNTTTHSYEVDISATTIDLQTGSIVNLQGKGFSANNGTGAGGSAIDGGGGAHGGDGADPPCCVSGGNAYGSVKQPATLGSGGGNTGGSGGGAIKLVASGTLTLNTTIDVDGNGGTSGNHGGGAGGSAWLDAGTLAGTGTVSANGGQGFGWGGPGGGGRVAVYYNTDSSTVISGGGISARGSFSVNWQNCCGDGYSAAGTIFIDDKDDALANGNLIVDNGNYDSTRGETPQLTASETYDNITIRNGAEYRIGSGETFALAVGGTLTGGGTTQSEIIIDSGGVFDPNVASLSLNGLDITNGGTVSDVTSLTLTDSYVQHNGTFSSTLTSVTLNSTGVFGPTVTTGMSLSTVAVNSGGTFQQETTSTISITTLTVASGGTLTHRTNTTAHSYEIDITATTVDIQSGATVNVDGRGFQQQSGTGVGGTATDGGGGGYGGAGQKGVCCTNGGATYGSNTMPANIGSGGGNTGGGDGGGMVKIIVSGTLTVNGTITADGTAAVSGMGGGGSGGSIWLDGAPIAGTGTLSADGGSGNGWGGGGGGGRIAVYYGGGDPANWTKTVTGGASPNQGINGGTGTIYLESTGSPPNVTSVTHVPATPTTATVVTLSGTATDDAGITQIQIYLDGTSPANLKHTCNFAPAQTPASCSVDVGPLSLGAHTTTIRASDGSTTTDGTENFTVVSGAATLSNAISMGRLKVNASSSVSISFTLQATLSGPLTVTFPAGFTVTSAAQTGQSSGCLSAFGFTSSTLTATKTSCSGTVTIGGATVTNPATPGLYYISWVNDDPGGGSVIITDSDQVEVSFAVDPIITFSAGSQTAACDGAFSGSGGAIGLGALTTAAVASSDVSSVPHVCTRVTANAASGVVVAVKSGFGALQSAAVPADQIVSSSSTLVAGTAGYGMCVGSTGGDIGRDVTTPTGAAPTAAAPFNGSCATSSHSVGGLSTSFQSLWTLSGPSQNAFARIFLKAAVSPATPAHSDYQDTLTFIATGTY